MTINTTKTDLNHFLYPSKPRMNGFKKIKKDKTSCKMLCLYVDLYD